MRKLDHAICVHKGHVSAVLDVDYSPTGKQFVSGAYDKTLRIWEAAKPKSVQVYHTKRKREYEEALVEKHKHLPAIKRIKNHQHLPRNIVKAAAVKETVFGNIEKRERRR